MAESPTFVTLADYELAAQTQMSDRARGYINGGATDEITLADNLDAWRRLALRPRVFTGLADPDPGIELLGRRRPHPLVIAPTAFAALTHPDAEPGIARAAAATDTIMCLSTLAGTSPAALAQAMPGAPRWFQLYVFSDRGVTRDLIAAAEADGYEALVVTADRPVLGIRERELRGRVRGGAAAAAGFSTGGRGIGGDAPVDFSAQIDASVTWSDVETFAAESGLPVIVKGILTEHDARLALAHGAAGVVVSNHGGRQLDTTLSGADALPEIADAVGDKLDVLVDGGIRRGTDVVKALALGARAVMVGRPLLWGLGVAGSAGAQRVLEILLAELRNALTLTGAPAAGLDASFIAPAPWAR